MCQPGNTVVRTKNLYLYSVHYLLDNWSSASQSEANTVVRTDFLVVGAPWSESYSINRDVIWAVENLLPKVGPILLCAQISGRMFAQNGQLGKHLCCMLVTLNSTRIIRAYLEMIYQHRGSSYSVYRKKLQQFASCFYHGHIYLLC